MALYNRATGATILEALGAAHFFIFFMLYFFY